MKDSKFLPSRDAEPRLAIEERKVGLLLLGETSLVSEGRRIIAKSPLYKLRKLSATSEAFLHRC
jgi:hypothetical protein